MPVKKMSFSSIREPKTKVLTMILIAIFSHFFFFFREQLLRQLVVGTFVPVKETLRSVDVLEILVLHLFAMVNCTDWSAGEPENAVQSLTNILSSRILTP